MKTSSPTRLALEIRAEMTRQQLDAADVADRCGLSIHQVTRRLNGNVSLTVDDAITLSGALSVPLWKLMERATPDEASAAA